MQSFSSPHVLLLQLVPDVDGRDPLSSILKEANIEVRSLPNLPAPDNYTIETLTESALEHDPSLIILAVNQQSSATVEQLRRFLDSLRLELPIIAAVHDQDPTQIRAMLELGVSDFITPPFTAESILPRVWQLLRQGELLSDSRASLEEKLALKRTGLIGKSPSFLREIGKLRLLARCDVTVMIWGETGTGKELVARAIHYLSRRSDRPFVPIDCGAIPPELAESELFGHERGAFTGAIAKHRGLVSAAERGTLFLDEVDALSTSVQAKLLRLFQELEYRPVGSSTTKKADVRVIAATNRVLRPLVHSGEFREDLYYRLNVAQLRLPALRERQGDIVLLARHFVTKYSARFRLPLRQFSYGALQKLLLHLWPGNIRELENVVEAAVALSNGPLIRANDLALATEQLQTPSSFREAKARIIKEFEREYVVRLLRACGGNISEAARAAGKNRRAFWELVRKHRVDVRGLRDSPEEARTRKPPSRAAGLSTG
jgi:two-component system response regulator GlrR